MAYARRRTNICGATTVSANRIFGNHNTLSHRLAFGLQIREKVTANAKKLLQEITERMQHVYYVRQRETIAQRASVGRLTEEVETLRKQLAISMILRDIFFPTGIGKKIPNRGKESG